MKKLLPLIALLTACATGGDPKPVPAAASDVRLQELQTSMTELLERIDVLNDRIARLEEAREVGGGQAPPPVRPQETQRVPAPPIAETPVLQQTPQRALVGAQIAETYRNALVLYGKNQAAEARAAFQKVFAADPAGELADNALFWIGETYFLAGDVANASVYYRRVAEEFGDQNKAPDALFKLALAQVKTGDLALARTTLQQVISRYPYSAPAASARAELNRIKY